MFGFRALRCRWWCVLVGVLATVSVALLVALLALQPWSPSPQPRFLRATVAANGYECATIGRQILERNGSAVDAAIATLFCEGVGCAQCMGLGGGFLATIYDARSGRVRVLNARERAPAASTLHMFDKESSKVGGLSIAVPGELRGYGAMYREYGRLPWRELVQPTAELCRRGHRVSEYMGRTLSSYSDVIKSEPSMRTVYLNPLTNEVWNTGDTFTEQTLAQTLDVIAREGPEAIHNGSLTAPLARDIQKMGGIITEDDLRNYRVEWQEPLAIQLSEEHTLYTTPLPGSGSVLAFIMNMLRGWSGSHYGKPAAVNKYWHRVIETFKYAYALRTNLGDPTRSNVDYNMTELEMNLTNPAFAMSYRSKVDDEKTFADWRHYGASFGGADDHGTAHVVVVAPDGSVVSVTSTINYIWGSQRRSRTLGFVLNNEMDDFAVPNKTSGYGMPPSPANMVGPGLQPLSSMVPSIVLSKNGRADLVIGAAGGTKITTQVALASLNVMVEGEDIHDAFESPRLHHQLMPMQIEYETGFDMSIIESLNEKGHLTSERGPTAGFAAMVGAARLANGMWKPQFDRRRVGSIDGF